MEAIRGAGGAGGGILKSAKDRKPPTEKPINNISSGSGDLMADLASKLVMRRKGISGGVKQAEATPASNVPPAPRSNLTSMVAQMAKNKESSSDNDSSDDDW